MNETTGRRLLAIIQLIAGYEFFVSGADKLLSGRFPAGLGGALRDGLASNPNGWYVAFLQSVVLPHSVAFGYLIEWAEVLAGIALALGAVRWLLWPRVAPASRQTLALALTFAAGVAAFGCAFMTLNFHLSMGMPVITTISPADPFDEGVDLDVVLTLTLFVVGVVNLRALGGVAALREAARQTLAAVRNFLSLAPRTEATAVGAAR